MTERLKNCGFYIKGILNENDPIKIVFCSAWLYHCLKNTDNLFRNEKIDKYILIFYIA